MRKVFLIVASAMLVTACNAQYDRAEYLKVVEARCANPEAVDIEFKEDYAEIEYHCDGRQYELAVDHNQKIIYTETETSIPGEVLTKIDKKLEKKYADWSRDEHSMIELSDTSFYKFELVKDGVEQNVYFAIDGKYFRHTGISAIKNAVFLELEKSTPYAQSRYDYLHPAEIYELPPELVEVSGIALGEEGNVFCVQDEVGAVFKFNPETELVQDVFRFTDTGDFEDLTIKDGRIYILRSDGNLFEIDRLRGGGPVKTTMLQLGCLNAEGLFFDPSEKSLFVACKEAGVDDRPGQRTVYQFDGTDLTSEPKEAMTIDIDAINDFLAMNYADIDIGNRTFNPSAFAIHPHTGEYFVLSASDRLLVVYKDNELKEAYPLPEERYYKPEGLAFASNGDLFFSSEGVKNGPIPGQIFLLPMLR